MKSSLQPKEWAARVSVAKEWPSVPEIAETYGVDRSMIEGAMRRGHVENFFLDCVRINPESWERFLASRYRQGAH